jgi:hypothetical protein
MKKKAAIGYRITGETGNISASNFGTEINYAPSLPPQRRKSVSKFRD